MDTTHDITKKKIGEDQSLKSLMDEAQDMYKGLVKNTEINLKNLYGFKRSFLEESLRFPREELETYDDDTITKIYNTFYEGSENEKQVEVKEMREDLIQAKEMCGIVFQTMDDYKDLEKTYGEVLDEKWKQKHSKKFYDRQMNRIKEYETMLANMPKDDPEYRKIKRKTDAIYSALTMDFILERVRNLGEKEQIKVMRQFFNIQEGDYVMQRCASRAKKFGLPDETWYKFFFNLEEHHLPKEYHVFNNLFLFATMRFIAYSDPYDKKDQMYVRALISNLTGLVYHKFEDSEMEQMITDLIISYDKTYEKWYDKFEQDNINHPNHPERIAYAEKADKERRSSIMESINRMGMEIPENVEQMKTDELHEYFNNELSKMLEKEKKETTGQSHVEEDEEGHVTIEPSFNLDKYRNPVIEYEGKFYYEGDDSFTKTSNFIHEHYPDIKNYRCMLELKNPDVPTGDLYNAILSEEEIESVRKEAAENVWYFLRYCLGRKQSVDSFLNIPTSDYIFMDDRGFALTPARAAVIKAIVDSDVNVYVLGGRYIGKTALLYSLIAWYVFKLSRGEKDNELNFIYRNVHKMTDVMKMHFDTIEPLYNNLIVFINQCVNKILGPIDAYNILNELVEQFESDDEDAPCSVFSDNVLITKTEIEEKGIAAVHEISRNFISGWRNIIFTTIGERPEEFYGSSGTKEFLDKIKQTFPLLFEASTLKELFDGADKFAELTYFAVLEKPDDWSTFLHTVDPTEDVDTDISDMVESLGNGEGIPVDSFLQEEKEETTKVEE